MSEDEKTKKGGFFRKAFGLKSKDEKRAEEAAALAEQQALVDRQMAERMAAINAAALKSAREQDSLDAGDAVVDADAIARQEAEDRAAAEAQAAKDVEAAKRLAAEKLEKEAEAKRLAEEAALKAEEAKRQAELAEQKRLEGERLEAERRAAETREQERAEKARLEQERLAAEQAATEKAAREKAEQEALERARKEQGEAEAKALRERQASERLAREAAEQKAKAEADAKAEALRLEQEAQEKAAQEKAAQEKMLAERALREKEAQDAAKAAAQQAEAAKAAQAEEAQAAKDQAAKEQAERDAADAARADQARLDASSKLDDKPGQADLPPTQDAPKKKGFLSRISDGLRKSSSQMSESVTAIFTKRKLDDEAIEELEDLLIASDLGTGTALKVTKMLAKDKFDKQVTDLEVKIALADVISETLTPLEKPLVLGEGKPQILLFVGVNGSGKTTTLGKIAARYSAQGKKVLMAAGDTFRAAAVEQLNVWGERANAPVVSAKLGADAAGLVYDAVERAKRENFDVLMIDTAGRLQNRTELMDELSKIVRVIKKQDETAPHHVILVLDATVGQNALSQTEAFLSTAGVTGLIMTKLDGTAKGGVLVALADKFALPIHAIGIGERIEDLENFSAPVFAAALSGVSDAVNS